MSSLLKPLSFYIGNRPEFDKLSKSQKITVVEGLKRMAEAVGLRPSSFKIPDNPADFAEKLSGGKWYRAKHLEVISNKIAAAAKGKNPRILISVPPRHGKSELASYWTPLWLLAKDPTARIILASYEADFAAGWGRRVRNAVVEYGNELGLKLSDDSSSASRWNLVAGGGMVSTGVGGSLTGRGANCLIIDDYVKNSEEAGSEIIREKMWDWFQTTAYSRLEPGGFVIVIACMTGDTPVLMADGTERPLRNIRIGDKISTYDNGKLSTSPVKNWINHGNDKVFKITMSSGRIIKANERHPFLTYTNGNLEWIRVKNLTIAQQIVTLKANGVNGKVKSALRRNANKQSSAKGIAHPITIRRSGLMATVLHPLTQNRVVMRISNIVTGLRLKSMNVFSRSKKVSAQFADGLHLPIAIKNISALTTAMPQAKLEDCSVMSVILGLVKQKTKKQCLPCWSTSDFTLDNIVSIKENGIEEVFDIEVDRTANFIANGVVSHNTRWHEDDLIGRLEKASKSGEGLPFDVIKFPALAEEGDPLDRQIGEPLWPVRYTEQMMLDLKKLNSPYNWSCVYQQSPSPEDGGGVKRTWWKFYKEPPAQFDQIIQSWDLAFKDLKTSDFTVGQVWGRVGGEFYLLHQVRDRMDAPSTVQAIRAMTSMYPKAIAKLIEDKANGPAIIAMLNREVSGIIPWPPKGVKMASKDSRLSAVVPLIQAGNVYLPELRDGSKQNWVWEFIEEHAAFPNGANDDQLDAAVQALGYLQPASWSAMNRLHREAKSNPPAASQKEMMQKQFSKSLQKSYKNIDKKVNQTGKANKRTRSDW